MSKIVFPLFALLLAAPPVQAGSDERYVRVLPANIDAQEDLRRQMGVMLQRSLTFRQQCQRLDIPHLRVQIRTDAQLVDRPYRARSTIRRSAAGGLTAWVAITAFGDPTQWIAHELEHIIEQLDGVRVPQLALLNARDAWRSGDNMFETERAILIGRLVLDQVQGAGRAVAHARKATDTSDRGD